MMIYKEDDFERKLQEALDDGFEARREFLLDVAPLPFKTKVRILSEWSHSLTEEEYHLIFEREGFTEKEQRLLKKRTDLEFVQKKVFASFIIGFLLSGILIFLISLYKKEERPSDLFLRSLSQENTVDDYLKCLSETRKPKRKPNGSIGWVCEFYIPVQK